MSLAQKVEQGHKIRPYKKKPKGTSHGHLWKTVNISVLSGG